MLPTSIRVHGERMILPIRKNLGCNKGCKNEVFETVSTCMVVTIV